MRLSHDEHMSKSEWVATHIGLGLVLAGCVLVDGVPQSRWTTAPRIGAGALLIVAVSILVARTFPRNAAMASVGLKVEVNRSVPVQV